VPDDNEYHAPAATEVARNVIELEKQCITLLKNPKFLEIIINEISKKKVVGETETVRSIIIVSYVRKVKNAKRTSSNLLLNDESGIGKDYTTKATLDIMPKDEVIFRTKITQELLTYWHNATKEPLWTWDGKIFYIEDIPSDIINSDVFKVFSSGGSTATVLVKQKPVDIEVNGKPAMIVTSFGANLNHENLRRYPICFLDDSEEQTLKIMERQSEEDETGNIEEYDPVIVEALKFIKIVKVVIPFAKLLPKYFPKSRLMRTHYKRFLDYIKSSACLHQYQREKDGKGNIIAEWLDYDIARMVLLKTTSNPCMIPLTKNLIDLLKYFENNPNNFYAVRDLESIFAFSEKTIQGHVRTLFKYGFLSCQNITKEGVNRPVPAYTYNKKNEIKIPSSKEILEVINNPHSVRAVVTTGTTGDNNHRLDVGNSSKNEADENEEQVKENNKGSKHPSFFRTEEPTNCVFPGSHSKETAVTNFTTSTNITNSTTSTTFIHLSLQEKIETLHRFIRCNNNNLNFEELSAQFPQEFLTLCLDKNIIFKLPDGKISWCKPELLGTFAEFNKPDKRSNLNENLSTL
jgi:hypothetical protein